jgi:multiple sugar transport system permease protein
LLSSTILVGLLVRTVDALRIFDQVFLLTQGGPGTTTEFISLFIYKTAFKFSQMGYASALLVVLFVVTIAVALAVRLRTSPGASHPPAGLMPPSSRGIAL